MNVGSGLTAADWLEMKVKVYKAYSARRTNELTLAVADIIQVEEKSSIGKKGNPNC